MTKLLAYCTNAIQEFFVILILFQYPQISAKGVGNEKRESDIFSKRINC